MAPELRLEIQLVARLEQRLKLAPQIIQSIEILQLPTLALEELVMQEMRENPVLELNERAPSDDMPAEVEADEEDDPIQVELAREWREFSGELSKRSHPDAADRKQEAMLNTAARPMSLQEYLFGQFHLLDVSGNVATAGEAIISNVDANGYLAASIDGLVEAAGEQFDLEAAERALKLVQSLDPPGIGARDLRECLLLQVPTDDFALVRLLISEHLKDIERNRLPRIARKAVASIDDIKEAIEFISHLNPRPGRLFSGTRAPRIVPDLLVEYTDTGYEVRLEDSFVPNVAISSLYEKLASSRNESAAARKYLRDKIRAARWLIGAIEQRKTTLYRISRSIVDYQTEFFDYGLSHLKPLKMQEIADKVGVHVSTVSRAIADKYIQTPRGVFPLKYFFTGGLSRDNGDVQTWRSVQQAIKEMVESEDKAKPLSDDQIAGKLSETGYNVARRTVTKYRKALKIASSRRRRSF